MIYKAISIATGVGTATFFVALILATTRGGGAVSVPMLLVAGATMALGLLTMIWHLNVRLPDGPSRNSWRTGLGILGPLAAAVYLWQVPQQIARPGQLQVERPSAVPIAISLSIIAAMLTYLAARNAPSIEVITAPQSIGIQAVVRLAPVLAVAAIAPLFGLGYWQFTFWIILPSLVIIAATLWVVPSIAIAMTGAAAFLGWIIATVSSKLRSTQPFSIN